MQFICLIETKDWISESNKFRTIIIIIIILTYYIKFLKLKVCFAIGSPDMVSDCFHPLYRTFLKQAAVF
jgi:hypothetical protein